MMVIRRQTPSFRYRSRPRAEHLREFARSVATAPKGRARSPVTHGCNRDGAKNRRGSWGIPMLHATRPGLAGDFTTAARLCAEAVKIAEVRDVRAQRILRTRQVKLSDIGDVARSCARRSPLRPCHIARRCRIASPRRQQQCAEYGVRAEGTDWTARRRHGAPIPEPPPRASRNQFPKPAPLPHRSRRSSRA